MDALLETQIQAQKIEQTQYLKEGEVTLAETLVLEAEINRDMEIARVTRYFNFDQATTLGDIAIETRTLEGQSIKARVDSLMLAYQNIKTAGVAFTDPKDKLFVHYLMVRYFYPKSKA